VSKVTDQILNDMIAQGDETTSHLQLAAAPATRAAVVHPTLGVPLIDDYLGDVTWPVTALAALDAPAVGVCELVVLENKISYLITPHQPGRLVLWGAWLRSRRTPPRAGVARSGIRDLLG
jgi:hypothetical protein